MSDEQYNPYKTTTQVNDKTLFSWPIVVVLVIIAAAWGANSFQISYLTEQIKDLKIANQNQANQINNLNLSVAIICNNTRNCRMVTK